LTRACTRPPQRPRRRVMPESFGDIHGGKREPVLNKNARRFHACGSPLMRVGSHGCDVVSDDDPAVDCRPSEDGRIVHAGQTDVPGQNDVDIRLLTEETFWMAGGRVVVSMSGRGCEPDRGFGDCPRNSPVTAIPGRHPARSRFRGAGRCGDCRAVPLRDSCPWRLDRPAGWRRTASACPRASAR